MSGVEHLARRVRGEYLEMPGLQLTAAQAQKLLGLDRETCRVLLDFLVAAKFLRRTAVGTYVRAADGVALDIVA
jgi:hypothetical protein